MQDLWRYQGEAKNVRLKAEEVCVWFLVYNKDTCLILT